jgi:hypothetical protein
MLMAERRVEVETRLDERAGARLVGGKVVPRTRHARARFVEVDAHDGEAFLDLPRPGDGFCPLTVRAALERMSWAYGKKLPRVRPQQVKSCHPPTVREAFSYDRLDEATEKRMADTAALKPWDHEPDRLDVQQAHAIADLVELLPRRMRKIAWTIGERRSDRWLGERLHCHNQKAAKVKLLVLDLLAIKWRRAGHLPRVRDIEWVEAVFIHHKM